MDKRSKIAWPLILLLFVSTAYVIGRRQVARAISTSGMIVDEDLEVYWDQNLTQVVDHVEWGVLTPGTNGSIIIWVQNIGNVNSTLYLYTGNYSSPEAQMYLRLEWNYTDRQVLQPQQATKIKLDIVVNPDIQDVDVFHFDIIISIEWNGETP